jgi:hypothetical protein
VCRRKKQKGNTNDIMFFFFESFAKDEGRPFEIGLQEQVSNHLKQLLLRVVVVSVKEKSERFGR